MASEPLFLEEDKLEFLKIILGSVVRSRNEGE
jgi:hypothetical protein